MLKHAVTKKNNRKNVRRNSEREVRALKLFMQRLNLNAVIVASTVFLGISVYYLSQSVKNFLEKPIASIGIKGNFIYLSKKEVIDLIGSEIHHSFVSKNLVAIRKHLESHPWIDRAAVRRQWPDTLLVTIIEQRPIARWDNEGFVNFRGELIRVDKHPLLKSKPQLRGSLGQELEIMRQYQRLSQLFDQHDMRIRELEQNQLGLWIIYLDNGWQLIAGRTQVIKKVQQLMWLLVGNKIERQNTISIIDMRYENGLAIQWQHEEQHVLNKQTNHGTNI